MVHSIIENLQREDLNPIEEAKAYQSLIDKGYTHADIAEKWGNHALISLILFDC